MIVMEDQTYTWPVIVTEDPDLYLADDRHGGPRPIPGPMIVTEDRT